MATQAKRERCEDGTSHCVNELPYRALVFHRMDQHGVPLYFVAGASEGKRSWGADKALRKAFAVHGGTCFYCKANVAPDDFTIDHAESSAAGGGKALQNLLVACRACNQSKATQVIEAFSPDAGRAWLTALLRQVEERLARLGS